MVVVNRVPSGDLRSPGRHHRLRARAHRSAPAAVRGRPPAAALPRRRPAQRPPHAAGSSPWTATSARPPRVVIRHEPCGVNFAEGPRRRGRRPRLGGDRRSRVQRPGRDGTHQPSSTERGVRVPEQLSVVGFDDIPFARYVTPPLTTAAVPVSDLGAQAWRGMWDLLAGRTPGRPLVLRPHVVRRGSSGPALVEPTNGHRPTGVVRVSSRLTIWACAAASPDCVRASR